MNTEVFGVFGDRETFDQFAAPAKYDRVLEGRQVTVGVSDVALGLPGRTQVYDDEDGLCVLWGEAFIDDAGSTSTAKHLYDAFGERGANALGSVNGSYLAVVERDGIARVFTDQLRSWECYYTDAPGVRVFGSDAAHVGRTIDDATPYWDAIREFTHFGNVFTDRTTIEELERAPFDGYLGPEETGELRRFVYRPAEFDYAGELADRMERALERRSGLPGQNGLLLSAGYDSRIILSQIDDIDRCYSIGSTDADEVQVARLLADQYDAEHDILEVDASYLQTLYDVVQYTQGLRESVHIHHRGNDPEIRADSIYHGLFFDTMFRGYFLPRDGFDMFGLTFPRDRLDPDPDVAGHYCGLLGCFPDSDVREQDWGMLDETAGRQFAEETIRPAFERCLDRADSVYNAIDLLGVKLKPTLPFRAHLADNYIESFIAADAELVEWHLMTPPEHRNDQVFLDALKQIDDDILHHRPPDRPHDSYRVNQVEKFLRRKLPVVDAFDTAWPDRDQIYANNNMDQQLFPETESIHELAPRTKLRINDVASWLDATLDHSVAPDEVIRAKR
ncbi:asparagine synthase-related protein [Haloarcula nitratireducens]|uniref:Asparagine synthetase domain-containing protein n=1 Tax=Haloarcula nitratireducens TaxID=2487749 RepID=A0AAW4PD67_9EURY|nr:asparagine synthase-related protein [Halomicroarcula nitratireducens]MBX0295774.1 hypothetical protein [Halomicroarcula nitratireducens]